MPETSSAPKPVQPEVPPAGVPSLSGLTTVAVGAVVVVALFVGRDVFLPVVLALLLAFVLTPLVNLLRRLSFGRVPAVIASVLFALAVLALLAGVIGLQVASLASDLPLYQRTVREKVSSLRDGAIGRIPEFLKSVNREIEQATKEKPASASDPAPSAPEEPRRVQVEVHEREETPLELARRVFAPLVEPLAMTGIVFVVLVFVLLQREDLRDRLIRLFGSSDLHRTTVAMDDAAHRLSRYFLIQLGMNAAFGTVIAAGLWLIGVPSPLLWGIFAMLMRFVPYIGSFLAGAAPLVLAAAVDPGWTMALATLALFVVTEPIMGHVVEPLVYGQSTGLSPIAVVLSAIFWTWLWGPIGLIIATPLTLCLVVLGRHVERLEFLDVLLGDRPALTPAENLYQRMLAGDPDEAVEHAELLLKDRSLTSYYDEVALRGLQLAASDAGRGVLSAAQISRINEAVQALVSDLSPHSDEPPDDDEPNEPVAPPNDEMPAKRTPAAPPDQPHPEDIPAEWRADSAILCIAGRGPLDEAAAMMLAQLLRKHGFGTKVLPHSAVSRSAIVSLDVSVVRMACISYLEISGSPAHLRYLLRRLRQRVATAPILVGLWPADDAILQDENLRSVVGADHYVASLRQAVVRCLREATGQPAGDGGQDRETRGPGEGLRTPEKVPLPA
jgi:predicted PurR-regulated permease PerM